MNNLVDCLGTESIERGLVETMGRIMDYFKKKNEGDVNLSRRNFLKKAGMTAAAVAAGGVGVLGNPQEAQAAITIFNNGNYRVPKHSMPEGVKYAPKIVKYLFKAYNNGSYYKDDDWKRDKISLLRCEWADSGQEMEKAFATDPAAAYVAEIYNYSYVQGRCCFGHNKDYHYGRYGQHKRIDYSLYYSIITIMRYFDFRYKKEKFGNVPSIEKKAYQTLCIALEIDKEKWQNIKEQVETGIFRLPQIRDEVKKKAILWSSGILVRALRETNNKNANIVEAYLENPIVKQVGYSIGNII